MFESDSIDATAATVRSDLAITARLASTVPVDLDILSVDAGLPGLPSVAINLHMPNGQASPATTELARCIRESLARPSNAALGRAPMVSVSAWKHLLSGFCGEQAVAFFEKSFPCLRYAVSNGLSPVFRWDRYPRLYGSMADD